MRLMRNNAPRKQGYSLEDAAEFLEYDRKAIEYWLRMGHLSGEWDSRASRWKISPQSLIDFLKQSGEPLPTGAAYRVRRELVATASATAEMLAD